jgi:acyl carrier protein
MPASYDIPAKLKKVLVQALGVDENDVTASATLQGDLGAESIDLLDIAFRIEREFGVKIQQGELFGRPIFEDDAVLVQDGQVTDVGLAELRAQMPYADLSVLERDPRLNRVGDLFTVDLLSRYVVWKLNRHAEGADNVSVVGQAAGSVG